MRFNCASIQRVWGSFSVRTLSSTPITALKANKLPPRPKFTAEEDIEEVFIKGGSGAGGQKINKTNSKVQLKHIPTGIVVTSQATRSRDQNRKHARLILAQKLQDMELGDKSRTSIVNERKKNIKDSKNKKSKRKYRELDATEEDSDLQEELELLKKLELQ